MALCTIVLVLSSSAIAPSPLTQLGLSVFTLWTKHKLTGRSKIQNVISVIFKFIEYLFYIYENSPFVKSFLCKVYYSKGLVCCISTLMGLDIGSCKETLISERGTLSEELCQAEKPFYLCVALKYFPRANITTSISIREFA